VQFYLLNYNNVEKYCRAVQVTDGNIGYKGKGKGKAILLQAWTGPESSRRLRRPDLKANGT